MNSNWPMICKDLKTKAFEASCDYLCSSKHMANSAIYGAITRIRVFDTYITMCALYSNLYAGCVDLRRIYLVGIY